VPQENIERAIKRAAESGKNLEELAFEAYGPGGTAIFIEAISDNKNRSVQEIKLILKEHNGKWAEAGSVRWAFEPEMNGTEKTWKAKFPQEITSEEDAKKLDALLTALEDNDDVQAVFTNAE